MNKDKFKKITMTPSEKHALRARIMERIDIEQPIAVASPYTAFFRRTHWYAAYAAAMILLFVVPTTFAAGRSLPGSPLYYIKTDILEPIEEALVFGAEERIEVMLENAENRLRETRAVLARGEDTSREDVEIATKTLTKKVSRARMAIDENNGVEKTEKIRLQKELLTVMDSYVAILQTDDEATTFASTTDEINNTSEEFEIVIRQSIKDLPKDADENELKEEIATAINELEERLDDVVENETPLDDTERQTLEKALEDTQKQLDDGDLSDALEILIFSDHKIDVEDKIRSINDTEKDTNSDDDTPDPDRDTTSSTDIADTANKTQELRERVTEELSS